MLVSCRRGVFVLARICNIQRGICPIHGSSHVSCDRGKHKRVSQQSESDSHEGVLLERPQTVFDGFAGGFAAIPRFLLLDMFVSETTLLKQKRINR